MDGDHVVGVVWMVIMRRGCCMDGDRSMRWMVIAEWGGCCMDGNSSIRWILHRL